MVPEPFSILGTSPLCLLVAIHIFVRVHPWLGFLFIHV